VDKLVFGRYCVDKTGAAIDVQAAALDWLITDVRQTPAYEENEPLGSKGKTTPEAIAEFLNNV